MRILRIERQSRTTRALVEVPVSWDDLICSIAPMGSRFSLLEDSPEKAYCEPDYDGFPVHIQIDHERVTLEDVEMWLMHNARSGWVIHGRYMVYRKPYHTAWTLTSIVVCYQSEEDAMHCRLRWA
jgi:hypothetical protein